MSWQQSFQYSKTSHTTGLSPLAPAAVLLPLPPLVGVTDLEMGVVGFSPSSFLVEGVLAFDDVPLRGLDKRKRKIWNAMHSFSFTGVSYLMKLVLPHKHIKNWATQTASDYLQTGWTLLRFVVYARDFQSAIMSRSVLQSTQPPVQHVLEASPPRMGRYKKVSVRQS